MFTTKGSNAAAAFCLSGCRKTAIASGFPPYPCNVFVRRLNFGGPGDGPEGVQSAKGSNSTIIPGWFIWERGYQGNRPSSGLANRNHARKHHEIP